MKILVGIDIQSVDDVEESIKTFGTRYLERVYTPGELESCESGGRAEAAGLAMRFAAKEATVKLLGLADASFPWTSIEVRSNPRGETALSLSGVAAQRAALRGVGHLAVSFSHTQRLATAVVVGESFGCEQKGPAS
jgi:holo-[acyl-carrier protein] synthase